MEKINNDIKIDVKNDFSNRFDRQLIISCGNAEIRSDQLDARSDEIKRLALNLIWAAQILLSHHELKWES